MDVNVKIILLWVVVCAQGALQAVSILSSAYRAFAEIVERSNADKALEVRIEALETTCNVHTEK